MRPLAGSLLLGAAVLLASPALAKNCPKDAVKVGSLCVDRYEATVWEADPVTQSSLVSKIKKGRAEVEDLTEAIQHGVGLDDYGSGCPDNGAGCTTFFAVSLPGLTPSRYVTWFQAVAACRNSGKRLLTNAEWQAAALGTPDPNSDNGTTDCATNSPLAQTGARTNCVSDVGVHDMVGNATEWVADWTDIGLNCTSWSVDYGNDASCFGGSGGSAAERLPAALVRGGAHVNSSNAGVYSVSAEASPDVSVPFLGFRCAR